MDVDVEKNTLTAEPAQTEESARREEPPPSYDSVYGRLKSISEESHGPGDCLKKFLVCLCSSVIGTILLGLSLAFPIAMIVIGSIYLHNCPAERFIPIYLIVAGVFGILQGCLTTSLRVKNQKDKKEDENARPNPISGLITCFLLAWFIAGSVWVYRTYWHFTTNDPTKPDYCHPTVYWFTFSIITVGYAFIALGCCCVTTAVLCACCLGKSD